MPNMAGRMKCSALKITKDRMDTPSPSREENHCKESSHNKINALCGKGQDIPKKRTKAGA